VPSNSDDPSVVDERRHHTLTGQTHEAFARRAIPFDVVLDEKAFFVFELRPHFSREGTRRGAV
jgi:hypothetical protein